MVDPKCTPKASVSVARLRSPAPACASLLPSRVRSSRPTQPESRPISAHINQTALPEPTPRRRHDSCSSRSQSRGAKGQKVRTGELHSETTYRKVTSRWDWRWERGAAVAHRPRSRQYRAYFLQFILLLVSSARPARLVIIAFLSRPCRRQVHHPYCSPPPTPVSYERLRVGGRGST